MAAQELLHELHAVLDLALAALEQEDCCDILVAVEIYARAADRLADACILLDPSDAPQLVGEACAAVHDTLHQRLQALFDANCAAPDASQTLRNDTSRSDLPIPHDVQPAAVHQLHGMSEGSAASASDRVDNSRQGTHRDAGLQTGSAAAGLQVDPFYGVPAMVEVLHQCQRPVAGSLAEIAGLESVKEELRQAVFAPMRWPNLFRGLRVPPRHFLLHGPPGTGKTMLVEKIAAEAGLTLLAISPSTLLSKWSGESEKMLRMVFDVAKTMQPAIVFFDEVDSVGGQRGPRDHAGSRQLLTELLLQMSGVAECDALYVFAATNRIQDCDEALLRRFDRRILISLPDDECRRTFFELMLARPEMHNTLSADEVIQLASKTCGYSSSDLARVCREAAMAPVHELLSTCNPAIELRLAGVSGADEPQLRKLHLQDFLKAVAKVRPAAEDQRGFGLEE